MTAFSIIHYLSRTKLDALLKSKQLKALSVCSCVETIFTMCENNIPILESFNNCDELRDFMMYHFDNPLNGTAFFQGDMVEFDGYAVPKKGEVIHIDSYDVNFTVGTINGGTKTFVLTLGKFTDEAFGVELPAYVREELIATLQGEW